MYINLVPLSSLFIKIRIVVRIAIPSLVIFCLKNNGHEKTIVDAFTISNTLKSLTRLSSTYSPTGTSRRITMRRFLIRDISSNYAGGRSNTNKNTIPFNSAINNHCAFTRVDGVRRSRRKHNTCISRQLYYNYHGVFSQSQVSLFSSTLTSLSSNNINEGKDKGSASEKSIRQEKDDDDLTDELNKIYQELKQLSTEIQNHDRLYYTPGLSPQITDDEYDALINREADICKLYPRLQHKLENESGLGSQATRYGGRVGPILSDKDDYHDEKLSINQEALELKGGTSNQRNAIRKSSGSSRSKKITHLENSPMQSLDNAMNSDEVVKWLNRVRKVLIKSSTEEEGDDVENADSSQSEERSTRTRVKKNIIVIAEPKMDGLSLSLRYRLMKNEELGEHYILESGATRGDGRRGEDITIAIQSISKSKIDDSNILLSVGMIPSTISWKKKSSKTYNSYPEVIEIRGEIVLPKTSFHEFIEISKNEELTSSEGDDCTKKTVGSLLPSQFSNARNAASGILLRRKADADLSEEEVATTKRLRSSLRFYAYSMAFSTEGLEYNTADYYSNGEELRDILASMGFSLPNPSVATAITFDSDQEVSESDCKELIDYHEQIMNNRDTVEDDDNHKMLFDFDIDGAVYKVSCTEDRVALGSSSRYPRWAIAHKFPAQCAVTKLRNIEVQVGRTGALTPVAILDPTDVGGVVVSRASLHNFHYARSILDADDNGVIMMGASVMISRAGDVIPKVLRRVNDIVDNNLSPQKEEFISLDTPSICPACGAPTYFDENFNPTNNGNETIVEELTSSTGQVLRCSGPQLLCRPRAIGALAHAYSRAGLDVNGLSEGRLQQLMDANLIRVPVDLFQVLDSDSNMKEKISKLPFWGEKSTKNLVDALSIVATNGVSLSRFIYSLGIRHAGVHSSKLIASAYGSVTKFFEAVDNVNLGDVPFHTLVGVEGSEGVKGIGPVLIESMIKFSSNKELVSAAKQLAQKVPVHDELEKPVLIIESSGIRKPFDGKSVVFTGSLPDDMTRSNAQRLAVQILGAMSTPSSISKSTGIVIEGNGGGKKAKEAKRLGIDIITGEEFMKLLEKVKDSNNV